MFGFRRGAVFANQTIYRTKPTANAQKAIAKLASSLTGKPTSPKQLSSIVNEHLTKCAAAAAAPEGQKILPSGRVSLKTTYYGRGYLDQHRSRVTGQTIHEVFESMRRVREPLEGFKRTGPLFLAQVYDQKESMKRFYVTVALGFLIGFAWAIAYRINDNIMFEEWDKTYREHLAIHQKFHAERMAQMQEEGVQFDTTPVKNNADSFLKPL